MMALDHVHVYASDPEATIAFYQRYFEAERVGSLGTRDGRTNEFMVLGGQVLVVSAFPGDLEAHPPPAVGDGAVKSGFGVSHLGINVADLDALVAKLRADDIDVHGEPVTTGAIRYVYLSAPDGVIVELTQYVVPRHLKPALSALNAFNRTVHRARKALTQTLLKLASLLLVVGLASAAEAQAGGVVPIERVVSTGQYTDLANAQINANGDVAFFGKSLALEAGIWLARRTFAGYQLTLALRTTPDVNETALRSAHFVLDDGGAVTAMLRTASDPVLQFELWRYDPLALTALTRIVGHGDECPDSTERATLLEDFRVRVDGAAVLYHAGACGAFLWDERTGARRIDGRDFDVSNHPLGLAMTGDSITPTWAFNQRGDILFAGTSRCDPPCVRPPGLMSTGAGVFRQTASGVDGVAFYGGDEPLMGGMPGPPVESLGAVSHLSFDETGFGAALAATSLVSDRVLVELGVDAVLIARPGGPGPIAGSTYLRVGVTADGNEERFWVTDQPTGPTKVLFEAELMNPNVSGVFDGNGIVAQFRGGEVELPDAGLAIELVRQVRVDRDRTIVVEGDLAGPDVQFETQNAIVAHIGVDGYRLVARAGTTYELGDTVIEWPEFANFELGEQPFAVTTPGLQVPRTSSGMDGRGRALANERLVFIERSLGVFIARVKDDEPYDWSVEFIAPDTVVVRMVGDAPEPVELSFEPMPVPLSDGSIGGAPLDVDGDCEQFGSITNCNVERVPETIVRVTIPSDGLFRNVRAVVRPQPGRTWSDANADNNEVFFQFDPLADAGSDTGVDGGVDGGGGGGGGGCTVAASGQWGSFLLLLAWRRRRCWR